MSTCSHLLAKVNGFFTSPPAMIPAPRPASSRAMAAVARPMNPSLEGALDIAHHHVSFPIPICIKFEADAFLPNATLPSPMSSVRAAVSSASSTDFLSVQRKVCRPLH